jgi:hypothetical protein
MVSEVAARISLFLMASRPIRPGFKKAKVSPDMSMLTSRLRQLTILDRRPPTDGFAVVQEDQRGRSGRQICKNPIGEEQGDSFPADRAGARGAIVAALRKRLYILFAPLDG